MKYKKFKIGQKVRVKRTKEIKMVSNFYRGVTGDPCILMVDGRRYFLRELEPIRGRPKGSPNKKHAEKIAEETGLKLGWLKNKRSIDNIRVTKISETFDLIKEDFHFIVTKNLEKNKLSITNLQGGHDFRFHWSKPETVKKIGEFLIKSSEL